MTMELYHVLNRGVDKRTIVLDDQDRKRFVADLYTMNDSQPVNNLNYRFARSMDTGCPYSFERTRKPLVQIHAWCLMNNHYHFLLSEVAERGISRFLHKFNMGYAKYFNERYSRSGALYQGKTKKILIEKEAHFLWILHYIHFNPLDYLSGAKEWRTQRLSDTKKTITWLKKYRWSSYRDYLGEQNFPEIVAGSFMFDDRIQYMQESKRYLSALAEDFQGTLSLDE